VSDSTAERLAISRTPSEHEKGQKRSMLHFAIRRERWGRNFIVKAEEPANNGSPASFAAPAGHFQV
jgi:hypothetical protein